jgi:hypothetical protein
MGGYYRIFTQLVSLLLEADRENSGRWAKFMSLGDVKPTQKMLYRGVLADRAVPIHSSHRGFNDRLTDQSSISQSSINHQSAVNQSSISRHCW